MSFGVMMKNANGSDIYDQDEYQVVYIGSINRTLTYGESVEIPLFNAPSSVKFTIFWNQTNDPEQFDANFIDRGGRRFIKLHNYTYPNKSTTYNAYFFALADELRKAPAGWGVRVYDGSSIAFTTERPVLEISYVFPPGKGRVIPSHISEPAINGLYPIGYYYKDIGFGEWEVYDEYVFADPTKKFLPIWRTYIYTEDVEQIYDSWPTVSIPVIDGAYYRKFSNVRFN